MNGLCGFFTVRFVLKAYCVLKSCKRWNLGRQGKVCKYMRDRLPFHIRYTFRLNLYHFIHKFLPQPLHVHVSKSVFILELAAFLQTYNNQYSSKCSAETESGSRSSNSFIPYAILVHEYLLRMFSTALMLCNVVMYFYRAEGSAKKFSNFISAYNKRFYFVTFFGYKR